MPSHTYAKHTQMYAQRTERTIFDKIESLEGEQWNTCIGVLHLGFEDLVALFGYFLNIQQPEYLDVCAKVS